MSAPGSFSFLFEVFKKEVRGVFSKSYDDQRAVKRSFKNKAGLKQFLLGEIALVWYAVSQSIRLGNYRSARNQCNFSV